MADDGEQIVQCEVALVCERAGWARNFTLFAGNVIRIGRSSINDVVLDFDGVSSYHAELFLRAVTIGGGLCVRDNSKNGTGVREKGTDTTWESLRRGAYRPLQENCQIMVPMRGRPALGDSMPSVGHVMTVYISGIVLAEEVDELDGEAMDGAELGPASAHSWLPGGAPPPPDCAPPPLPPVDDVPPWPHSGPPPPPGAGAPPPPPPPPELQGKPPLNKSKPNGLRKRSGGQLKVTKQTNGAKHTQDDSSSGTNIQELMRRKKQKQKTRKAEKEDSSSGTDIKALQRKNKGKKKSKKARQDDASSGANSEGSERRNKSKKNVKKVRKEDSSTGSDSEESESRNTKNKKTKKKRQEDSSSASDSDVLKRRKKETKRTKKPRREQSQGSERPKKKAKKR